MKISVLILYVFLFMSSSNLNGQIKSDNKTKIQLNGTRWLNIVAPGCRNILKFNLSTYVDYDCEMDCSYSGSYGFKDGFLILTQTDLSSQLPGKGKYIKTAILKFKIINSKLNLVSRKDLINGKWEYMKFRIDYVDEEVVKNIHFVAEEVLFEEQGYEYVLFSIKQANLSLSLNLLSKIWEVYEAPSLIFSSRKEDLGLIKATLMDRFQYDNLFRCVKGLVIFFQKHEDDVLWIAAHDDLTVFTETLFEKP